MMGVSGHNILRWLTGLSSNPVAGFLAGMLIGRHRLFSTNKCLIYGCLLKTIADALLTIVVPTSLPRAVGLSCLSMAATGWVSVALVVCIQLACKDRNLGLATLLLSSARNVGGSIPVVVYASVLQNQVKEEAITRLRRRWCRCGSIWGIFRC